MGIRREQPGAAKAAAQAGTVIGKAKRAEEDRARAEREQARAQQIAAQQSARQAALDWEQQKMLLNSQQDFAHEMRMRQTRLDAEARAREWEVEKMEMASRMDFEQGERERLRRIATYNAGKEAIDNNEGLTDVQKDTAHFYLSSRFYDVPEAAAGLGLRPQTTDETASAIRMLLSGDTPTPTGITVPPSQGIPELKPGHVVVRDNKGNLGQLPIDRAEEAVAEGGFTIVSSAGSPIEPGPRGSHPGQTSPPRPLEMYGATSNETAGRDGSLIRTQISTGDKLVSWDKGKTWINIDEWKRITGPLPGATPPSNILRGWHRAM